LRDVFLGTPTLQQLTGIDLFVHRSIEPETARLRKAWILECFGDMQRVLGLPPAYFRVHTIHLTPAGSEAHPIGEYDRQHIFLSTDLEPGPGFIFRGMHKLNGGTLAGVLRHELGHATQREFLRLSRGEGLDVDLSACVKDGDPEANLSWYAAHGGETEGAGGPEAEYFAEAFSAWAHPDFDRAGFVIAAPLLAAFQQVYPRRL
jgi:hypothetical protein